MFYNILIMAGMKNTVCNREGGCKTQFGQFADASDEMIAKYVQYQKQYMGNECEVKKTCSQICGVLQVELDNIDIPGEIITGVQVSGITRDGTRINKAPGVAYTDKDNNVRTQLV